MKVIDKIHEYVATGRRDTGLERSLAKELRCLPQAERYEILRPFISRSHLALVLAEKSGLDANDYRKIWNDGLDNANASTIKWWISTIAPNLGWRKTFLLFEQAIDNDSDNIALAIYHVPYMFGKLKPNDNARNQFETLVVTAENKGLLHFNPDDVWGHGWRA
jgi:hypothetical protein